MPQILPFRGLRYDPAVVGDVARAVSPPYDVISPSERESLVAADDRNVVQLVLPEVAPGETESARYARARELLDEWTASGILRRDDDPALYLYEQRYALEGVNLTQRGILAAVSLVSPDEGGVLPHERTYAKIVEDRLNLLRATATNLDCIFCVYESDDAAARHVIDAAVRAEPDARFTTPDSTEHVLWRIVEPEAIATVAHSIEKTSVVIADGHHRWTTARQYRDERRAADGSGPWDHQLMLLVDASDRGPSLLPIHRVVDGVTAEDALARLSPVFKVEPANGRDPAALAREIVDRRAHGRVFCMFDRTRAWWLSSPDPDAEREALPAERSAAWRDLDVAVLHGLVFDRLLGSVTPRFVHHPHEAATAVDEEPASLAFLLAPMTFEAVRIVAETGEAMPQKSTYFIPKPATGVVLRPLD